MLVPVSRALVMVLLAACGSRPTQAVDSAKGTTAPVVTTLIPYRTRIAMPRPEVALPVPAPTLEDELRWPLSPSSHPVLEPHFAIAAALAEPGVTWTELCRRGVQNRHSPRGYDDEPIRYLRAWCAAADHDLDTAIEQLAGLAQPETQAMRAAIALDVANILVDGGTADTALHILAKHPVRLPDALDTLAATYLEIDRLDDAREVNDEALLGEQVDPARCHRAVRKIALEPTLRSELVLELEQREQYAADPTCRALAHVVSCWANVVSGCAAYLNDQNVDEPHRWLFRAYYEWPSGPASWATWHATAAQAIDALGVNPQIDGAELLAISALEAALRASQCNARHVAEVEALARRLTGMSPPNDPLRPRIAALANVPRCETFVSPTEP